MTYADWYEPKPVKPETDALADAMGQALTIERLEAELARLRYDLQEWMDFTDRLEAELAQAREERDRTVSSIKAALMMRHNNDLMVKQLQAILARLTEETTDD